MLRFFVCCALSLLPAVSGADSIVLVTGATGRTGSEVYRQLKASPSVKQTRALVTSIAKAKQYLNCSKCDASEGIYVGDVTDASSLKSAFQGVTAVAIAVGAPGNSTTKTQHAIDYEGVINQAQTLAVLNAATVGLANLQIVLCSSMGTTIRNPLPFMGGTDLFYKLNAEAFLGSSGLKTVIVKPCGLSTAAGGSTTLVTGHDDKLAVTHTIARADVAAVMVEAVLEGASNLRFDLCAKPGPATNPKDVLQQAKYPWQV